MFMFSRRFVSPYHCFLLEFGHGIYYISYGTDSALGDRRKTQDDCRQSAQPRPRERPRNFETRRLKQPCYTQGKNYGM
ncbi:unnamed protein product, partial [Porites lobata]